MSRILMTGGAGFIGSHLCERLFTLGHKVFIIDNFNAFYDPEIKRANIVSVQKADKSSMLTVLEGDITDKAFVDSAFDEAKPEIVVHLAAMAGVRPSIENPELYVEVNINGTVHILEAIRRLSVKRLVFASSSSVYGNNEKTPFSEDDCVDFPISPYAATKKAGELILYTYHKLYHISTACLRFFTVYGPRQRPDLAIHKFTELILKDEEIPVFGDGNTRRDYTYIDDIIDGVVKAIDWTQNDNAYEIFNLGESNTIRLDEMIETIENVLGKEARIKRMPAQQGDVERTWADVTKSKKILGYAPSMDFGKGVREFVKWYREKQ